MFATSRIAISHRKIPSRRCQWMRSLTARSCTFQASFLSSMPTWTTSSVTPRHSKEWTSTWNSSKSEFLYLGSMHSIYLYLSLQCHFLYVLRCNIRHFLCRRAKGELITPATWMRRFILSHPDYQRDSVISPSIAHDLMMACSEIGNGTRSCPELLGDITIER